jgi:hypothetical protein
MSSLFLLLFVLPPDTGALGPMETLLPASVRGWNLADTPVPYPGMKIFEYMDGAGEIYRAYDFRDLLVGRYARTGEEEILVELFDMGSPANAYGVFTYMKGRGPALPIGQEGEYKGGLLTFWKGEHFVCVKTDRETPDAKEAVLELGRTIGSGMKESGGPPEIVGLLPGELISPETVKYFYRDEILNIHYYLGEGNILHLGDGTEGVLARTRGERGFLLIIRYPTEGRSAEAWASFRRHLMPGADSRSAARGEKGRWTDCRQSGQYCILVFEAPTSDRAAEIIESVERRLP